jgi:hypothetical protein
VSPQCVADRLARIVRRSLRIPDKQRIDKPALLENLRGRREQREQADD